MNGSQAAQKTTVQELFRYLLRTEQDYRGDLNSPKLVGIISECFHLTHSQVRMALHNLEERKFIEVIRAGESVEIRRVEILNRNWMQAPKSPI